jgi:hypothetical protein
MALCIFFFPINIKTRKKKDFECFFPPSLFPPLAQTRQNPYSYAHATIMRKKDDPLPWPPINTGGDIRERREKICSGRIV